MTNWQALDAASLKYIGDDPVLIFIPALGVIEACLRPNPDHTGEWSWFGCMNTESWPFESASHWMPCSLQVCAPAEKPEEKRYPQDQETVLIWTHNDYGQHSAPEFGWLQARYHAEDCSWRASNASDSYWIHDSKVVGWMPLQQPEKQRQR